MNDRKNSAVQRPYGRSHGALLAHVPEEENGTDDGDSVTSETDISDAGEDGSDDNSATPDAVMAALSREPRGMATMSMPCTSLPRCSG